ncbi:hypothetical protein DICVIV_12865 [Dictyocaulus viviparus]|uniref:C3H1-type domain-containing protein n=1 Tax=Dictyocaulus viviparus TaxID=29172 RepID=A0A0D8XBX3_DICVI|nr:hypothetical protein DICVIV_12865 [Dictyocaulus viviparus]
MALNLISSYDSDEESYDSGDAGICGSPSQSSICASHEDSSKPIKEVNLTLTLASTSSYLFGLDECSSSDDDHVNQPERSLSPESKPLSGKLYRPYTFTIHHSMSLNLISSYDSDEESYDSGDAGICGSPSESSICASHEDSSKPIKEVNLTLTLASTSSYLFGLDQCSSSDDDHVNQPERSLSPESKPLSGSLRRLPNAGMILKRAHVDSSVFSSEREREDHAQALTLSQHVPLTEKTEAKKRPICRAYTYGKCKRGDKCRFAHPVVSVASKDAATIAVAPRMYNADDISAKKSRNFIEI